MMEKIKFSSEYFNAKDTLECGQVFRYNLYKKGYKIISLDKCCYLYTEGEFTYIESEDIDYFSRYFDLERDYFKIYDNVCKIGDDFLTKTATLAKGVRILLQDLTETAFSFIISQNNNIPRIKSIIEKLCEALGEKKYFDGEVYYAFPTVEKLALQDLAFYKSIGLGYRDEYLLKFAQLLNGGYKLENLTKLQTKEIIKELLKIHGIGKKVADCIAFFGYNRTDSFPVDTWIEKIYLENLQGKEKNPVKISNELSDKFKDLSGYIQQYLFYYKRTLEKSANA